jgi:predicted kinase
MIVTRPGSLVLLSGAPGSGKSTFARRQVALSPDHAAVISSDQLRQSFFGVESTRPRATDDRLVFETMTKIVEARLRNGMTTIVDATLPSDKERAQFAEIADRLGVPVLVVIIAPPSEVVHQQNQARTFAVPPAVVDKFLERLQLSSKWPHVLLVSSSDAVLATHTLDPDQPPSLANRLLPKEVDVIGDVHGNITELRQLLETWGYNDDLIHPDGRTLLFLGDLIDRGPTIEGSLLCLELAMQAVSQGHVVLLGNHEMNLLRGLRGQEVKSSSTRATLHGVLCRGKEYADEVKTFLRGLPEWMLSSDKETVYCHADIPFFDPRNTDLSLVRGTSRIGENRDVDGEYAAWWSPGSPRLVRGHILATSERDCVTSLDEGVGFGGPLVGLRNGEKTRIPVAWLYEGNASRAAALGALQKSKLVSSNTYADGMLSIWKYSKKAFFAPPKVWAANPLLAQTRSLVLGLHGEPVNRPFDRYPNYGEADTLFIPAETQVVAAEKLNGFLGQVFCHPYSPETVLTTSGSFEGEYLDMFKQALYRTGHYGTVRAWVLDHPNHTLLFEVLDPADPHIIDISPKDYGPHLIGVGVLGGGLLSEEEVDEVAAALHLRRPKHLVCSFEEARAMARQSQGEGFMVRGLDGAYLCKLKSPLYLAQKLVARMGERNAEALFANPTAFKRDRLSELEETHFLVDALVLRSSLEVWKASDEQARLDLCRAVIAEAY